MLSSILPSLPRFEFDAPSRTAIEIEKGLECILLNKLDREAGQKEITGPQCWFTSNGPFSNRLMGIDSVKALPTVSPVVSLTRSPPCSTKCNRGLDRAYTSSTGISLLSGLLKGTVQ